MFFLNSEHFEDESTWKETDPVVISEDVCVIHNDVASIYRIAFQNVVFRLDEIRIGIEIRILVSDEHNFIL